MCPARVLVTLLLLSLAVPLHAEDGGIESLEHVTIFVRDYDEALAWYVGRLGLVKVEDRKFGTERWLTVAPPGEAGTRIVLAVPREALSASVGQQHNWVFRTADCRRTHEILTAHGIKYLEPPRVLPWGCQAIIEDPYGNHIVLRSPAPDANVNGAR